MRFDWIELSVRTFFVSPNPKIHVRWKDVLHQTRAVFVHRQFEKNILFSSGQNFFPQTPLQNQTVPERCFVAYSSLFMTFTHSRHNVVMYGVSKQLKHDSTYTLMCHCYMNQDTLQYFSLVPLQQLFRTQDCISHAFLSELGVVLCWCADTFVCIFPIINLHFGVWWRR